jgi:hypothetical protein
VDKIEGNGVDEIRGTDVVEAGETAMDNAGGTEIVSAGMFGARVRPTGGRLEAGTSRCSSDGGDEDIVTETGKSGKGFSVVFILGKAITALVFFFLTTFLTR